VNPEYILSLLPCIHSAKCSRKSSFTRDRASGNRGKEVVRVFNATDKEIVDGWRRVNRTTREVRIMKKCIIIYHGMILTVR
jgi:hypothetical protein